MDQATHEIWTKQNQQYLVMRVREVQHALEKENSEPPGIDFSKSDAFAAEMINPPALISLGRIFDLSEFELFVILICAGYELDGQFANAIRSQTHLPKNKPCFELAFCLFPGGNWNAVTPVAPLRHWRLLELERGDNLIGSQLHIDECVLHYLSGISYLDTRLQGLVHIGQSVPSLAPSLHHCVDRIIAHWNFQEQSDQALMVQLCGQRELDLKAIAQQACARIDLIPYHLSARNIPADQNEAEALAILWQRESLLNRTGLIISSQADQQEIVNNFVSELITPCIVIDRQPLNITAKPSLRIDVPAPDSREQLGLWTTALGEKAKYINGGLSHIVSQFSFSAQDIENLSRHADMADGEREICNVLWRQCRSASRKQLESLAERIESTHDWDDLVLPATQKQSLRDIVSYARQRHRVYSDWGFGAKSQRGKGGSCLFYGPSGTGKTMAASVIANSLELDLYRIDLSQVINKYIGETEKNMARIFDMAEDSGAILLFDEADSLFAKRTEVKTSNDRNANINTSYLLQRMESYSGLAILTTNMKKEMDSAFMRRIRFATQFPFPDIPSRKKIWGKIFPSQTPIGDVDLEKLANLEISGGNIRNIALNASVFAAEDDTAVDMTHLAKAARREYGKLEKSIKENELRSWL